MLVEYVKDNYYAMFHNPSFSEVQRNIPSLVFLIKFNKRF